VDLAAFDAQIDWIAAQSRRAVSASRSWSDLDKDSGLGGISASQGKGKRM
jgi:hypothetical protein